MQLLTRQLHGFAVLRISIAGLSQKLTSSSVTGTEANIILWREDDISLWPGSGVFKTFACNVPFRITIGTGKKNFLKHFLQRYRVTKCSYAINTIKYRPMFCMWFTLKLKTWTVCTEVFVNNYDSFLCIPLLGLLHLIMSKFITFMLNFLDLLPRN